MLYASFERVTAGGFEGVIVEVHTRKDLRKAAKVYRKGVPMDRGKRLLPVVRFTVTKLTTAQWHRLPKALRSLTERPDDSVAWLERLYGLEDPRPPFRPL